MNRERVCKMLEASGLPVAYRDWGGAEAPEGPCALYYLEDADDLKADDANYCAVAHWCAELYSVRKDDGAEEALEAALGAAETPYAKNEIGETGDGAYLVAYHFTTIGD